MGAGSFSHTGGRGGGAINVPLKVGWAGGQGAREVLLCLEVAQRVLDLDLDFPIL